MRRALTLLALLPLGLIAADSKTHLDFRRDAEAAYRRKDYAAALAATKAAFDLRPDSPRYLHNLAALSVLTKDHAAALGHLRQAAALGIVLPVERDPDFGPLQGTPEFLQVLRQFAANKEPRGDAQLLAELPGRTGILEGIAFRARTGDLLLSDVHHRCIWRRDRTGQVTRFSAEDEALFGIFGLAIDEARNTLWAATTAVPEMAGYTSEMKGLAAIAEFNLATSELRNVVPIPSDGRDHGLGDLIVAADGTVYASDSLAPVIWKFVPGSEEVDKVVDSPVFTSLQGMMLAPDTLVVADYTNGLFALELSTGNIHALAPPPNTTLLGIDGLVAIPGGLIAVQNGVEPQRVLLIKLAADARAITEVSVLASGQPHFTDLALATLVSDAPVVIAGAGWEGFNPEKTKQPPAHTVRIFQLDLAATPPRPEAKP